MLPIQRKQTVRAYFHDEIFVLRKLNLRIRHFMRTLNLLFGEFYFSACVCFCIYFSFVIADEIRSLSIFMHELYMIGNQQTISTNAAPA